VWIRGSRAAAETARVAVGASLTHAGSRVRARAQAVCLPPVHRRPYRRVGAPETTAKESTERDSQIIPNQRQWMLAKGGTMLSLKTMTGSKLKVLKREVEAAIRAKVSARRQEIVSELSKLSLLDSGRRAKVVKAAARGMGAAKYRNSRI
jgi:hypothetical protein